jgi:hypothetical protein
VQRVGHALLGFRIHVAGGQLFELLLRILDLLLQTLDLGPHVGGR